jgi:hypothetical protein
VRLRADIARGGRRALDAAHALSSSLFNARTAEMTRFAIIWFTACALIVQTILTLGSTPAQAGTISLSVICHSAGAQGPVDSHDAVSAGHLKCIACVLGQSLAPPMLVEPGVLPLVAVTFAYVQRGAANVSPKAIHHAHAPRGPPATV